MDRNGETDRRKNTNASLKSSLDAKALTALGPSALLMARSLALSSQKRNPKLGKNGNRHLHNFGLALFRIRCPGAQRFSCFIAAMRVEPVHHELHLGQVVAGVRADAVGLIGHAHQDTFNMQQL